jgi:hypothetical protein
MVLTRTEVSELQTILDLVPPGIPEEEVTNLLNQAGKEQEYIAMFLFIYRTRSFRSPDARRNS